LINNPNITFILLTKIAGDALSKKYSHLKIKIIKLPILKIKSFTSSSNINTTKSTGNFKFTLGFIGTVTSDRTGAELLNILSENYNITFKVAGKCSSDIVNQILHNNYRVDYFAEMPSTELYNSVISEFDYSVFIFGSNQYIYRVSGTLVDSIAHCKPIIVIKSSAFIQLFNQYGDIGYMCDDIIQLKLLIRQMSTSPMLFSSKLQEHRKNIKFLLNDHLVNSIHTFWNSNS
jgi:hypothetical protein